MDIDSFESSHPEPNPGEREKGEEEKLTKYAKEEEGGKGLTGRKEIANNARSSSSSAASGMMVDWNAVPPEQNDGE